MSIGQLHHVGIAVADMETAIEEYTQLLGYELQAGPFADPLQKVSVCFLRRAVDSTVLELVAPLGEGTPVDRILKRGGGVYHLCYEVVAMEAALQQMAENGCFLISGPTPAVAFDMRPIAWLMTRTGLLLELLQQA